MSSLQGEGSAADSGHEETSTISFDLPQSKKKKRRVSVRRLNYKINADGTKQRIAIKNGQLICNPVKIRMKQKQGSNSVKNQNDSAIVKEINEESKS